MVRGAVLTPPALLLTPVSLTGVAGDPVPFVTPEEGSPPYASACLPDGSVLAVGWGDRSGLPREPGYTFYTQEADLWRLIPGTDSVTTIGSYISSERLRHINESGAGGSGPHPFSRSVVFTGDEDRIYIGGAERLQIEVRSLDGELLRILRGPDAELVIDDAFIDQYRAARLTGMDSVLQIQLEEAEFPMPERYPAYSDMLVDDLGYILVERFVLPWSDTREWGVFDPDGVFLGHLQVPSDFTMTDVTADQVAGIAVDELGVGRVRVYQLERGGAG